MDPDVRKLERVRAELEPDCQRLEVVLIEARKIEPESRQAFNDALELLHRPEFARSGLDFLIWDAQQTAASGLAMCGNVGAIERRLDYIRRDLTPHDLHHRPAEHVIAEQRTRIAGLLRVSEMLELGQRQLNERMGQIRRRIRRGETQHRELVLPREPEPQRQALRGERP